MNGLRSVALLWIVAAWALAPAPARAHAQPFSWVDVTLHGDSLRGVVTSHIVDLAHETGEAVPESLLSSATIAQRRATIVAALSRRLDLSLDGARLHPAFGTPFVVADKHAVRVPFALRWPGGSRLLLRGPLFTWESEHETYFNVRVDSTLRHQDLLDAAHRESAWTTGERRSVWRVAARFVREGVHHIFLGADHVLFIIGLLLLGGSLGRLLKIVTAFTVAHSITLALATLGIVQPPSSIVEPAIALSIVAIGIENLLVRGTGRDRRALLAFGFGFVHGFGFAGVLRELELPADALGAALAAFNVGVELGQLAIVLAVAPALALLRAHRPRLAASVLTWGSAAVIAAGAWWFVQRVFMK